MRWYSQKIFSNRKYFFSNLQISNKNGVFRSFLNLKKILPVGIFFFCECHSLEYRDRYVVRKFEGRGNFLSEISRRGAKVPLTMHENIIKFKALPIFLPKGDSWGFSICHS